MSTGKAADITNRYGAALSSVTRGPQPVQGGQAPAPAPARPMSQEEMKGVGRTRERQFGSLDVGMLHRDPTQPREEFDEEEIAALGQSIKKHGQIAPIRVRWHEDRWVVMAGERRFRAAKLVGLPAVKVEFIEKDLSPADILEEQIVENVARAEFKPVEEANAYKRLMDLRGWTPDQLGEEMKLGPSALRRMMSMTKLTQDVAALVDSGAIGATAASELGRLESPDEQRQVAAAIVQHDLDHKTVVDIVNHKKAEEKARRAAEKAAAEAEERSKAAEEAPAKKPRKPKAKGKALPEPPTHAKFKEGRATIIVSFAKAVGDDEVLKALEAAAARVRSKVEGRAAAMGTVLALPGPTVAEDAA